MRMLCTSVCVSYRRKCPLFFWCMDIQIKYYYYYYFHVFQRDQTQQTAKYGRDSGDTLRTIQYARGENGDLWEPSWFFANVVMLFAADHFEWMGINSRFLSDILTILTQTLQRGLAVRENLTKNEILETDWVSSQIFQNGSFVISQSGKYVHRFYRVYATRRVISPISPC